MSGEPGDRGEGPPLEALVSLLRRTHLAPPGSQCAMQRRDRIALRMDRASEATAEAAVVARGPVVVGYGVDASRRTIRMQAALCRGLRREHGAEHVGSVRHRVRTAAPRCERVGEDKLQLFPPRYERNLAESTLHGSN